MVHGNETIHVNHSRSHTWYMGMRQYMLTTLIPIYGKWTIYLIITHENLLVLLICIFI